MKFQPSRFSAVQESYGWSPEFDEKRLTPSATADRLGLSNAPASDVHWKNLGLLSDFLAKLPFEMRINSGYRAPNVNAAVGGAGKSQHMQGLAADITPIGLTNRELAHWLYVRRAEFPELDQVIWYTDTTHVHVGICPVVGVGCPGTPGRGRQQFMYSTSEAGSYNSWAPSAQELMDRAAFVAEYRPRMTMAVAGVTLGIGWIIVSSMVAGLGVIALATLATSKKKRQRDES